ncbi:MAG: phosphoribosylglycinamide formyltransferase [Bdellovibrionales bacterium]|nr:phosphoribosylglycinamide formyltransferase [Bdellovibrionales bacterium]
MQNSRLVIFSSANGSTFEAIVDAVRSGEILAEVVGLIVNRSDAGVIERAKRLKVPFSICEIGKDGNRTSQDAQIESQLKQWKPDWAILAGYMNLIGPQTLSFLAGKILNVHPSLLPKFGGKGMYGSRVHQAVIEHKEAESGITVHIVTPKYDEGPIVAQKRVPISPEMSWQQLEEKIKALEKPFYIETIADLVSGRRKLPKKNQD